MIRVGPPDRNNDSNSPEVGFDCCAAIMPMGVFQQTARPLPGAKLTFAALWFSFALGILVDRLGTDRRLTPIAFAAASFLPD